MRNLLIEIDEKQYNDLVLISDIFSKSIIDIVEDALNKEISRYRYNDKLKFIKAKFWTNKLEYELAKNKGIIIDKDIIEVNVIGKAEIYGNAYYRIVYNDRLMSVPFENIEFYSEDDRLGF